MNQRVRQAFDAAEHQEKATAAASLREIAVGLEPHGAEYMEPWVVAQGFDIQKLTNGADGEPDRYWERFAILGILRPFLSCDLPECNQLPLMCLHGKLMHMQRHGWTGKDAAVWLRTVAHATETLRHYD